MFTLEHPEEYIIDFEKPSKSLKFNLFNFLTLLYWRIKIGKDKLRTDKEHPKTSKQQVIKNTGRFP